MSIEGVGDHRGDEDVSPQVDDTPGGEEQPDLGEPLAPAQASPAAWGGEHARTEDDSLPTGLTTGTTGTAEHDVYETAGTPTQRQPGRHPRFRERPRGWWLRSMRDNQGKDATGGGTAIVPADDKDQLEQPGLGASAPQGVRRPQLRRPRGLVPAILIVVIILVAFGVANEIGGTPIGTPTPTPAPTTVAVTLALNAPVLSSCRTREAAAGGRAGAQVPLDTLQALCGHVNLVAASYAVWHNLTFHRGLQFTGKNSGAVFALDGRYSALSGTIYLDDKARATGGVFDIYAATVPGDVATYRALYERDLGLAPQNRAVFSVPVSGVRYLALVERCCILQNTIIDIMATLTRAPL